MTTHRDHFVVAFTREELISRLRTLTSNLPDELVKKSLKLKDTRDWSFKEAREKARKDSLDKLEKKIIPYAYRPFDDRFICYEPYFIDRDRYKIMRHLKDKENLALVATKRVLSKNFSHSFITKHVCDKHFISDQDYVFPLYLYPEESEDEKEQQMFKEHTTMQRTSNFKQDFLHALKKALSAEPSPEEIFYYIYAILYCPIYRKLYNEFLKIDFPRIPLPPDQETFHKLSSSGEELIKVHLLRHPALKQSNVGFPQKGDNEVKKVFYDDQNHRVYINQVQYFDGIPEEVWEYRIGSYRVMEKYLKERKGRKLTLEEVNHYIKMAKAISLTIEIQNKIDQIYRKAYKK